MAYTKFQSSSTVHESMYIPSKFSAINFVIAKVVNFRDVVGCIIILIINSANSHPHSCLYGLLFFSFSSTLSFRHQSFAFNLAFSSFHFLLSISHWLLPIHIFMFKFCHHSPISASQYSHILMVIRYLQTFLETRV